MFQEISIKKFTSPLLLLLFFFTLLTLYQSILLPLGEADDETDHYQYLRFVARTGHPPLTEAERNEAGFKGGLAPLYYWLTAWPVALVGEDTLPDIRRVDARPERHLPTDGLGFNHVLHTLDEQWPWHGQVLAWHLVRFLSLPMAWITIIATYILARRLWPEPKIIALGAAVFVAFLPRFVLSSAVINDDNLVFTLTSLLLLVQVIILQKTRQHRPVSARIFAVFGALFGLALLTKYFSLILLPEVIFTLVIYWLAQRPPSAGHRPQLAGPPLTPHILHFRFYPLPLQLTPLLAFFLAFILTAGPWFSFITLRFNRIDELGFIPGLAASLGEPQITEGLVGLLSGQSVRPVAATYSLPAWFSFLYRSFWFEFGWMQLFAPGWVYALFTLFLLLALLGHSLHFTAHPPRPTFYRSPILWLLSLHLALFLLVVLARYVLSATIDTGQGRHLYPALAVIALLVSMGLFYFKQRLASLPRLSATFRLLPATCYLLLMACYLLPAAYCLLFSSLITAHYPSQPVTITPPDDLPITYRHNLPFAPGLVLAGFDVARTASAGETLPVTFYWRAGQEAQQDYLVSACVQDQDQRPVACWAGHFADGRYPARAWEAGDTLRDTIYIPIPTCDRVTDQTSPRQDTQRYQLHLEVWPLNPDFPDPTPEDTPVLQQTFTEPALTIQAADPLTHLPQPVDLWRGQQRLTAATSIQLNESLHWLAYAPPDQNQAPVFVRQAAGVSPAWSPLPGPALFLPCPAGPSPLAHLAHFIASPTLPAGLYVPNDPATSAQLNLLLNMRQRTFAPLSSTLTFAHSLAPLSLEVLDQPPLNLIKEWQNGGTKKFSNLPTLHPASPLPVTIRWQARRWMADPLIVSLKLLDKDFQIGGERLATLGDRYPNVLWAPTEVIEETYPVQLKADAPPGLYRLEISVLHQDKNLPAGYEYLPLTEGDEILGPNLYPAAFRLLDPADGTLPPHPFSAQIGDSIYLTGYALTPSAPLSLALYWRSTAKTPTDYTVFTQLLGPDGQVWAQWDNPPQAGRYPTTAWAEQDNVVDRYTLTLRAGAPPGPYRLLVGMYDPATGQRLPATRNGQPQPDQAIELTTLTIDN